MLISRGRKRWIKNEFLKRIQVKNWSRETDFNSKGLIWKGATSLKEQVEKKKVWDQKPQEIAFFIRINSESLIWKRGWECLPSFKWTRDKKEYFYFNLLQNHT